MATYHSTIFLEKIADFALACRQAGVHHIHHLSTLVATTYSRVHHTTIGLGLFHFCVRNGNRWDKSSIIATKRLKLVLGKIPPPARNAAT